MGRKSKVGMGRSLRGGRERKEVEGEEESRGCEGSCG